MAGAVIPGASGDEALRLFQSDPRRKPCQFSIITLAVFPYQDFLGFVLPEQLWHFQTNHPLLLEHYNSHWHLGTLRLRLSRTLVKVIGVPMDGGWVDVWEALRNEFADITDVEQLTRVTVRLLIAALLGGILGFEREQNGKAAGVRTHMLVSIGAALFVLVPHMAGSQADAMSRVVQGIVAGIGFLGAGTILKGNRMDAHHVKGLTTAAGLWMTAAIGIAAGMGREATAVLSTLLAWAVLALGPRLVERAERKSAEP